MSDDLEDELRTYRAHRSAIIRLESGDFALFDPRGTLLSVGPIDTLTSFILDGPSDYDLCLDRWIGRGRPTAASHDFLATLGLLPTTPPPTPLKRRI